MNAIHCKNIHKHFKKKKVVALRDIDFTVPKGETFGIIGPNGSGKSTLVRILSTLLIPDTGTATVFTHDVVKSPMAVRRMINRVSVDAAFFKKLSAWENLRYAARLYGVPKKEARERTLAILDSMGFPKKRFDEPLEELSRGMQQKVAIARSLFTSPILLLLDEPTTGLDPRSKQEVQEFIRGMKQTTDITVLLTTHDMAEAEALCDRIAIINGGGFVAVDRAVNLREKYGVDDLEAVFMKSTGKEWAEQEEDNESEK
ncbi:MAG TPA: ABC transporter ATP-binding protein [Candidatus Edwardsbacteria bacterium]|nr:ABC transporter ATP-binding protein [Candidatus Edwardsbacteria bacterium]